MAFAFEKLVVYQKAVTFADACCSLTRDYPRGYFFLADQFNRAALSIAANIAEGNGRFTKPDRKNFFGIARGSVQECVPLLDVAVRQGLTDRERQSRTNTAPQLRRPPASSATGPRVPVSPQFPPNFLASLVETAAPRRYTLMGPGKGLTVRGCRRRRTILPVCA